jgi:VIT1/CCC1 family predicted Fe2+/Mn2+ transporter
LVGGAPILVGAARVTVWGVVAMLATAVVGRLFGSCWLNGQSKGLL